MEYVGWAVSTYDLNRGKILEVGSLNVNGSVRPLFNRADFYAGIDRVAGVGVDLVMDGSVMNFWTGEIDTVVSTSALEHDPHFWLTLAEVGRVLKPGGHFILTTVSWGFFEHDKPDFYRFLPDTWPLLMDLAGCDLVNGRDDPQSGGPQLVGRRRT